MGTREAGQPFSGRVNTCIGNSTAANTEAKGSYKFQGWNPRSLNFEGIGTSGEMRPTSRSHTYVGLPRLSKAVFPQLAAPRRVISPPLFDFFNGLPPSPFHFSQV